MKDTHSVRLFGVKSISIAMDLLTIGLSFVVATFLRKILGGEFELWTYFRLWPFLLIFWAVFEKMGLYNGVSIQSGAFMGPVQEMRQIFYALAAVFVAIGFSNYCYRPNDYLYSRSILLGTFILCAFWVPTNRILLRKFCNRLGFWGVPAVLIGSGELARTVFDNLNKHPEYGLKVAGYFTDRKPNNMPSDASFLGTLADIPAYAKTSNTSYAILAKDLPSDSPRLQDIISQYGKLFRHLLFVPQNLLETCTGVTPKDLAGTFGLEIRHNLQIPSIYRLKRLIDYALALPALLISLPVMGGLALLIKLDSPGPVLFKHQRVSKGGKSIHIYKFRTMVQNADQQLHDLLKSDPGAKKEWDCYGKLRQDPRITRMGKWLRKTSLDELPQLLNVLQGHLTLVGPRPLVEKELEIYGGAASLFDQVLPGLTGLWQVSGRNHLTYAERAELDQYYVNNWSVWLDLYILAKTLFAVLFRHGAR